MESPGHQEGTIQPDFQGQAKRRDKKGNKEIKWKFTTKEKILKGTHRRAQKGKVKN